MDMRQYFQNVEAAIFGPMPNLPHALTDLGVNQGPSVYEAVIDTSIALIKADKETLNKNGEQSVNYWKEQQSIEEINRAMLDGSGREP